MVFLQSLQIFFFFFSPHLYNREIASVEGPQDMLFRARFALFLFAVFAFCFFAFSFSLIRRMALYCMVRLTDESMSVGKKNQGVLRMRNYQI